VLEEAKKEVERIKQEKESTQTGKDKTQTQDVQNNEEKKAELPELPSTDSDLGDPFLFVGNVILDETWKCNMSRKSFSRTLQICLSQIT